MASVIFHSFNQIKFNQWAKVKLFRSHKRETCKDGEQLRDFIYVKDVIAKVCYWLMDNSRCLKVCTTWVPAKQEHVTDLINPVFSSLGLSSNIEYIGTARSFNDLDK